MSNNYLKKNILIIDDHELSRAGLMLILSKELNATVFEIEKIIEIADVYATIDLIVLDICLLGVSGVEGIAKLLERWPEARIMLVSTLNHHHRINAALEAGASCFLNKNSAVKLICRTAQLLLDNRLTNLRSFNNLDSRVVVTPKTMLSNRLIQVLALLAEGRSNKFIADKLSLSEHTIRNHIAHLMQHFKVHNRTKLILAAYKMGYLEL